MPESPIACAISSTRRVDTPPIQASWMTATDAFPSFCASRTAEVAAGPQLRDLEIERAKPRVERAVAVAVAPVQPIGGPFVPASADQPLDVGLHQQLQDALGHSTQKVTVAAFCRSSFSGSLSSVIVVLRSV